MLLICAALSVVAAFFKIHSLLAITCAFSIILLYGYFRKGTVRLAMGHLRNEELAEAERAIEHTTRPERLDKRQRSYYLFVKGFVAREKERYEEAKIFLEEAIQNGLSKENDIAMALLALTDMEMVKKNKAAAKHYFSQMKDLKVSPQLMPSIRKMQAWLGM